MEGVEGGGEGAVRAWLAQQQQQQQQQGTEEEEEGGMAAAVAKVTQHSSDAAQRCAYTARDRLQHGW
eukprot:COSAG02_NODE_7768_length_2855_cov_18.922714_1_plen_66_part_10